jgi:hypothetical protein
MRERGFEFSRKIVSNSSEEWARFKKRKISAKYSDTEFLIKN